MLVHVYIAPVLPATSVYSHLIAHFIKVARSIQASTFSLIARPSLDPRLTARRVQTGATAYHPGSTVRVPSSVIQTAKLHTSLISGGAAAVDHKQ